MTGRGWRLAAEGTEARGGAESTRAFVAIAMRVCAASVVSD